MVLRNGSWFGVEWNRNRKWCCRIGKERRLPSYHGPNAMNGSFSSSSSLHSPTPTIPSSSFYILFFCHAIDCVADHFAIYISRQSIQLSYTIQSLSLDGLVNSFNCCLPLALLFFLPPFWALSLPLTICLGHGDEAFDYIIIS